MSAVSEIVARLIAAGTPPELAAMAVTEAFAAGAACGKSGGIPLDEAAERRRAYDRERKRARRQSGGIPAESPGSSATALTLDSSNTDSELKKEKTVRVRKHPLPVDWQPKPAHFDAAQKLNIVGRQPVLDKAEDMRIWAGSTGALKADWDLTFHGFLRRDAARLSGQPPPNGAGGRARPMTAIELELQHSYGTSIHDQTTEPSRNAGFLELAAEPAYARAGP